MGVAAPPRPASAALRPALKGPRLGWSGDSGVLPVRHSVERARAASRVVPPLSRGADGADGGCARTRPTLEYAGWPGGPRPATHAATAAAGLPMDSGAPWFRAATAARTTAPRTHTALRRHTSLGAGRSCRLCMASGPGASRYTCADRTVGGGGAPHVVLEPAGALRRDPGVRRALRAAGHQPEHLAELGGGFCRELARHAGECGGDRGRGRILGDADPVADRAPGPCLRITACGISVRSGRCGPAA